MKAHISNSLAGFFKERFLKKFNLEKRTGIDDELIIFGLYTEKDVNIALSNKKPVTIIWAGTDVLKNHNFSQLKQFKHIAQSMNILNVLTLNLITAEYKQICVTDLDFWKPVPLGDKIYIYTSKDNPKKYGVDLYTKIIDYFGKDKFIIADYQTYSQLQLKNEIYPQVKFALRLTPFDGLSESVVELGLMGRYVIHNDLLPNCIIYSDFKSIVNQIEILLNDNWNPYFLSSNVYNKLIDIKL